MSRTSFAWGIPVPEPDPEGLSHVIYVWMDALTNYYSDLCPPDGSLEAADARTFFPEAVHLIGKDILRFHSVYWPAFLLSAGLPLPTTIWAHGWWLRDQKKMSKSVGNVVRPDHLVERFGPEPLRYFLLREMVFGQDANFSDEAFVDRYNADLANDLGNTTSRLVTLARQAFDGRTSGSLSITSALQPRPTPSSEPKGSSRARRWRKPISSQMTRRCSPGRSCRACPWRPRSSSAPA